jgi:hypothetical protein
VSLVDEGTEQVLDIVAQLGSVNAIFPAVYSYSSGTAGRQLPGHPFPGHGKQSEARFRGGNFTIVHPEYYKDTNIDPKATQAPDHPGFDILASLSPSARKRGMKVICLVQDSFPKDLPGLDKLRELDFNGQLGEHACKNNPYYRNFMLSTQDAPVALALSILRQSHTVHRAMIMHPYGLTINIRSSVKFPSVARSNRRWKNPTVPRELCSARYEVAWKFIGGGYGESSEGKRWKIKESKWNGRRNAGLSGLPRAVVSYERFLSRAEQETRHTRKCHDISNISLVPI